MKLTKKHTQKLKEAFEFHKNADKLIITQDGHVFLPQAQNHAANHCYKLGIEYTEVNRKDIMNSSASTSKSNRSDLPDLEKMTVKELKAFAEEKGIKLESTRKADIIQEITEKIA